MWRVARSQLRHRPGRAVALLLGVLVATASFSVLTGTSVSQRLEVRGKVAREYRGSFDLLVRAPSARGAVERRDGLVRANELSSIFGGISIDQWHRIQRIPGVAVAAPLANVGYVMVEVPVRVRVPAGRRGRALFRVRIGYRADRGLSRVGHDATHYVYVTPNRLIAPVGLGVIDAAHDTLFAPSEALSGGSSVPVCVTASMRTHSRSPWDPRMRGGLECFSRRGGGYATRDRPLGGADPYAVVDWPVPVLLAAVDPTAEAALDGLDRAIVAGRALRPGEQARRGRRLPSVPVLLSSRPFLDEQMDATVERLPGAARMARPMSSAQLRRYLAGLRGQVVRRETIPLARVWPGVKAADVDEYWTVGPGRLARDGAAFVAAEQQTRPADAWASQLDYFTQAPALARDRPFRTLTPHLGQHSFGRAGMFASLRTVGRFDPERLPGFNPTSARGLPAFSAPTLTPGDAAARRLLGGRALLPNGNIAGPVAQPPLALTTLTAMPRFLGENYTASPSAAPISTIRVRVAGVHGIDDVSRERLRAAAQRIAQATHLTVDIVDGASAAPQTLVLAQGRLGRPPLRLTETFTKKGVATAILRAVDRKSLVLFALILVVCALFAANAVTAAVRGRRTELAVLATLGWSARKLFAVVLLEAGAVGFAAGVLGGLVALAVGTLANVDVSLPRAAIAVPAAVILTLAAALAPA
ncbi:MAG: hypothetical protein JWR63_3796, partial [Conexibacter sp.]|nr:hypothetical protein [Conexibacter sp.]